MIRTALVLAILISVVARGALAQTPSPFTDAQAETGHSAYSKYCASCHGADLKGIGDFPALTGSKFITQWGTRTTHDFYSEIENTMPFCAGGSLSTAEYTSIVAYILKANGAQGGGQPFAPETTIAMSSLITGEAAQ